MKWLMVDMNSYFASVEQHLRPELRDLPIAVVPVESEGTCVIAASYLAKRLGVRTGTPVREARRLCPGIRLIRARPKVYVEMHHALLRCVEQCAPVHKVYSIDEWTIQLIGEQCIPDVARRLAESIKEHMLIDFGPWLTCSIGIAQTRLLAKIASDLQKPNGLVLLLSGDLPERIEHLSLVDLCGIGDGMLVRLNQSGINNIRELWGVSRQQAIKIWGSITGAGWWAGFHGFDEPEVVTHRRSMIHSKVLEPRLRHDEGAHNILVHFLCKLAVRLRTDGYCAQSLRVDVKYMGSGNNFSSCIPLSLVQDTPTLLRQFHQVWQRRPATTARPLKVSVCVERLVPASKITRSLFDELDQPLRASLAIDAINRLWGATAIYPGTMHNCRETLEEKIAFGRIPTGFD